MTIAIVALTVAAHAASLPAAARLQEATDSLETQQARYALVERELRCRDPFLDPARRAERERIVQALGEYRERGEFARTDAFPGRNVPVFVDDAGRRCAIANLLSEWGEDGLVTRVAATRNHAFVAELAGDAEFGAWLDRVGLTFEEAARIQGPNVGARPTRGIGAVTFPTGPAPASPDSPGPSAPSTARPGPVNPNAMSPSTGGPAVTGASPGTGAEDFLAAQWWRWWEFNKLAWLAPNRIDGPRAYDERTRTRSELERRRIELLPLLERHLEDRDAQVRAAATIAWARALPAGRAGEVELRKLFEMRGDASARVRADAVMALGALRTEAAVHALLGLAHDLDDESATPDERSLAVLALGLARRRGLGDGSAALLPAWEALPGECQRDGLAEAVAMHQVLAPAANLAPRVRAMSGLFEVDPSVTGERRAESAGAGYAARARAVEALRHDGSPEALRVLLHSLGAREIEERRSAALALGAMADPLALQPLQTAFDLEEEPLSRGFLLLSVGRKGGEGALAFLVERLAEAPQATRPWTALALGILAREADDPELAEGAREAVRKTYPKIRNRDTKGAFLLAMGIGQDRLAADVLRHELRLAKSERTRGYAALGLAMTGHPKAAEALRKALERETSPFPRSAAAQGLGLLGADEDVELLARLLTENEDPDFALQIAAAMGFHGTHAALDALVSALAEGGLGAPGRAGAVQAIGMLLDEEETFLLADLSERSNFAVFPGWFFDVLQTSL